MAKQLNDNPSEVYALQFEIDCLRERKRMTVGRTKRARIQEQIEQREQRMLALTEDKSC